MTVHRGVVTSRRARRVAVVVLAGVAFSLPLLAQRSRLAPLRLVSLVSGLTSPTFVTHAGDGSNRLFITEQRGLVRVWHPSRPTPTVFLDVRARVLAGGERGLLGLAFHPLYQSNGRLFLSYTRTGDGAIVVAAYDVSADPDIAVPTESVVLTIPHPTFGNPNGGMLAFGPGGYLFVGVGDGGAANDPPNNAQNINVLLGKILRIDVDHRDAAAHTPYSSPTGNPFVGRAGLDEIYAIGLRNPWRFSFDRVSGQQWVADVGQGAREEVNTPIVEGGNYGWRIYEGTACTNIDDTLCRTGNYIAPQFDYSHGNGRCSITGGYVYRGPLSTFSPGTYVYGDFCSGEIFAWNGRQQRILLDTDLDIASFGEDEEGELHVVDLGGVVGKLTTRP